MCVEDKTETQVALARWLACVLCVLGSSCQNVGDVGPDGSPDPVAVTTLHAFLVIHTGEGRCWMGDADTTSSQTYVRCRDELKTLAQQLRDLEVPAVFQFHGRYLELLAQEDSANPDRFSFARDLAEHQLGLHMHSECLETVDTSDVCVGLPDHVWGDAPPATTPNHAQWAIRVDSALSVVERFAWLNAYAPRAFSSHGTQYRYQQDAASTIGYLSDHGISILTSTALVSPAWPSGCPAMSQSAAPWFEPLTLTVGDKEVAYYDHTGNEAMMLGGVNYDNDATAAAFGSVAACAKQQGESTVPNVFGLGTHCWNMTDDANANDVPDGVEDLQQLLAALQTLTAAEPSLRITFDTIDAIESLRLGY